MSNETLLHVLVELIEDQDTEKLLEWFDDLPFKEKLVVRSFMGKTIQAWAWIKARGVSDVLQK